MVWSSINTGGVILTPQVLLWMIPLTLFGLYYGNVPFEKIYLGSMESWRYFCLSKPSSILFILISISINLQQIYFATIHVNMNVQCIIDTNSCVPHQSRPLYWIITILPGADPGFSFRGGGGAKGYVPVRTLQARNRTHLRQGSRAA